MTFDKNPGRELNHIEDLVLFHGAAGAKYALAIIKDLTDRSRSDLTVKWDGKLAIYFGHDENKNFMMGTKGNWAKNTPCYSATEMRDYILSNGDQIWRKDMAESLYQIFPYLRDACPLNCIIMADLLFSPILSPKTFTKNKTEIEFTPNQVTYSVKTDTITGRKIQHAPAGIAVHAKYKKWGDILSHSLDIFDIWCLKSSTVFVIFPTFHPYANVTPQQITHIDELATKNEHMLNELLAPKDRFSDLPSILYRYNNQTMRKREFDKIGVDHFLEWLATSNVSQNKQKKISIIIEDQPTAFPALFELYRAIAELKNEMIRQLDEMQPILKATTNGMPGGEGYVSAKHKIKLVPRNQWVPS